MLPISATAPIITVTAPSTAATTPTTAATAPTITATVPTIAATTPTIARANPALDREVINIDDDSDIPASTVTQYSGRRVNTNVDNNDLIVVGKRKTPNTRRTSGRVLSLKDIWPQTNPVSTTWIRQ